jgi:hypothetical protein
MLGNNLGNLGFQFARRVIVKSYFEGVFGQRSDAAHVLRYGVSLYTWRPSVVSLVAHS